MSVDDDESIDDDSPPDLQFTNKRLEDKNDNRDYDEVNEAEEDDGTRHVVELPKLLTSTFKGHCFRPLAAWKNSRGKYEISKEQVSIDEKHVEILLVGSDSGDDIARLSIPLSDVSKAEFCGGASFKNKAGNLNLLGSNKNSNFGNSPRSVLHLYVGDDTLEAASQSLDIANIASFSLVQEARGRVRLCFEEIDSAAIALLKEYFRRAAIYFKVVAKVEGGDRIFFKPVVKGAPPKYDTNKPGNLDMFLETIETTKHEKRLTFSCKVCEYFNEDKDVVARHVREFHVEPRRTMTERDLVMDYIETSDA